MKFLTPFFFLLAAGGIFYWVINPIYKEVGVLKDEQSQYVAALERADRAGKKRDNLVNTYNSFSDNDLRRLQKLLPDSVDNIKLLVDLSALAGKYGASMQDIKIADNTAGGSRDNTTDIKPYGTLEITFTSTLTYSNYLRFLSDIQQNLRLSDVVSVEFNSQEGNEYTFTITLKTYVMK